MCKNADIHPLAQLSTLGKGLLEASIRNLGFSGGLGVASMFAGPFGSAVQALSSFFGSIAMVGILLGFVLFYLLPFLPFLYFFFAVGGWIKGLFEAMVGVPLWALAHLRIDGDGLPGEAAANGYFLIFEIFLRPMLILFGLLASVAIFGAMVKVLNEIFYLVVSNTSGSNPDGQASCLREGANPGAANSATGGGTATTNAKTGSAEYFRGPIDEFFFTVVYAIIVYMIGMSSFKLIDQIPNYILRWMGSGTPSFGDQGGEPVEGLVSRVTVGGGLVGSQVSGALGQLSGAAKHGVSAALQKGKTE